MRPSRLLAILTFALLPASAYPNPPDISPAARTQYEAADWAEWDAQARITQGDYDSAVQAQQHTTTARRQADQLASHASKPPTRANSSK